VRRIDVTTAAELEEALRAEFPACHVLLMAAAPADFRPREAAADKISRSGSLGLELEPTEDILAGLTAQRRDGQTIIGFAAEHGGDPVGRARQKLECKAADMIVLNDVSDTRIGFESEQNAVTLVEPGAETPVSMAPKAEIADAILDRVAQLRVAAPGHPAQDRT
jgi:phosphopantothenoylcysteine decarboxylase/phosphopantothenate--cysteine ligase